MAAPSCYGGTLVATNRDLKAAGIELHPDGFERFTRAIKVIGKAAPKHRPRKPKKAKPKKG